MRYISRDRKISSIKHTGIQYIPGHAEKFVDYIVDKYLPPRGKILDLGGGGLRFAIPVALKGESIIVIDIDSTGVDIIKIVNRINKNLNLSLDAKNLKKLITIKIQDVFEYLETTQDTFGLITAFRLIHFFPPEILNRFFKLVYENLDKNGIFALSAMTPFNYSEQNEYNEIYLNTKPFTDSFIFYRKLMHTEKAKQIRKEQNLPVHIHFVDKEIIKEVAHNNNLDLLEYDLPSTRIVNGYILRK